MNHNYENIDTCTKGLEPGPRIRLETFPDDEALKQHLIERRVPAIPPLPRRFNMIEWMREPENEQWFLVRLEAMRLRITCAGEAMKTSPRACSTSISGLWS